MTIKPRLNDDQVIAIRRSWVAGSTLKSMAAYYHVSITTIGNIVHRRTRAAVGDDDQD